MLVYKDGLLSLPPAWSCGGGGSGGVHGERGWWAVHGLRTIGVPRVRRGFLEVARKKKQAPRNYCLYKNTTRYYTSIRYDMYVCVPCKTARDWNILYCCTAVLLAAVLLHCCTAAALPLLYDGILLACGKFFEIALALELLAHRPAPHLGCASVSRCYIYVHNYLLV